MFAFTAGRSTLEGAEEARRRAPHRHTTQSSVGLPPSPVHIALRCPITRCRSGSVPLPPVICSIWSSKGKAVPFPPLAWSLDGPLSTCPSSDYCFTSSHLDGPIFSIPHLGLRRHDSQPSADTPAEANDITLAQDIVAEVFDAIAESDSGLHLWWLPASGARGARVFNFLDPRMDSLFSAPRVMPKGRTALPALSTSSMLGNLGWRWRWACDGMRWACDSTHARNCTHTDAHTFDLPILPLESWRFLGTTEMKMLSKMSKKQKKRRQPMLINMLKTDERFQHKAAKEPSRCLCSRFWASASLCDCAVPACRNYFTAASTRCTGRRTATVTRHSYHAKLCQQATVPCHPGGGEFGPDGGA